ncbi:MAG: GNAT family N-acetyltransferase [Planctomycetota bacterium]
MPLQSKVRISMIRGTLDDLPQYNLPPLYTSRMYRPGDMDTWIQIESAADKYNTFDSQRFHNTFASGIESLPERLCFICAPDGTEIATATAWFDNNYHGRVFGRLHWVAVIPPYQGKGLSKPLVTITLNRLRQLGYTQAVVTTQPYRIPAINLYLKFGFLPDITSADDRQNWQNVLAGFKQQNLQTAVLNHTLEGK